MTNLGKAAAALFKKIGGEEPFSTVSALAYWILGAWIAVMEPGLRSLVLYTSFFLLAVSTWLYHYRHTGGHDLADSLGMAMAIGALAVYVYGAAWIFVLAAAVAIPLIFVVGSKAKINVHYLLGILIAGGFLAAWSRHEYLWLGISAAFFASSYIEHAQRGSSGLAVGADGKYLLAGDVRHAYWHVGTALGMFFLALAGI